MLSERKPSMPTIVPSQSVLPIRKTAQFSRQRSCQAIPGRETSHLHPKETKGTDFSTATTEFIAAEPKFLRIAAFEIKCRSKPAVEAQRNDIARL
jgi:hypothetical protein